MIAHAVTLEGRNDPLGASHHLVKQLRQAMRLGKLFGGKGRLLACSAEERSKDTNLP